MPSIRIDQSLGAIVLRPLAKKRNTSSSLCKIIVPGIRLVGRRCASINVREPERPALVHHTAPVNADFHQYEQRREVSTSDLDKSRDRRERVVILGSGIWQESLSGCTER
jgi:hypothetical protein